MTMNHSSAATLAALALAAHRPASPAAPFWRLSLAWRLAVIVAVLLACWAASGCDRGNATPANGRKRQAESKAVSIETTVCPVGVVRGWKRQWLMIDGKEPKLNQAAIVRVQLQRIQVFDDGVADRDESEAEVECIDFPESARAGDSIILSESMQADAKRQCWVWQIVKRGPAHSVEFLPWSVIRGRSRLRNEGGGL